MSEVVAPLPVWKKGATAHEFFMELAHLAKAKPERFSKAVLVYYEIREEGRVARTHTTWNATNSLEVLGLLEMGKAEFLGGLDDD